MRLLALLLCALGVLQTSALKYSHITMKTSSISYTSFSKNVKKAFGSAAIGLSLATGTLFQPSPAAAADTVVVGKCLLQNCRKELGKCLLNPKCFANVICLNTCNGRKDEAECQIKCGDMFENDVVGEFNSCAVSQKKCVPQKQNEGLYPVPAAESMVTKFDTNIWNTNNGRWYISAGLNKIFDTFDCQVHFFNSPSKGKFYAKLNWRVRCSASCRTPRTPPTWLTTTTSTCTTRTTGTCWTTSPTTSFWSTTGAQTMLGMGTGAHSSTPPAPQ
mmetsp:Transcript_37059/g.82338  ORF Transcript_37059/g.82338 Transcript_37059/m.82338 type:complete len:274 (+) Transcript_37059:165-986(+)